jgi:hypothetical protein
MGLMCVSVNTLHVTHPQTHAARPLSHLSRHLQFLDSEVQRAKMTDARLSDSVIPVFDYIFAYPLNACRHLPFLDNEEQRAKITDASLLYNLIPVLTDISTSPNTGTSSSWTTRSSAPRSRTPG